MQEAEGPEPVQEPVLDQNSVPVRNRERKFWIAMGAYGILGVAIWFTLGEGTALVFGRQIEIRLIPLFVIGTFAFRTWVAREADRIRRRGRVGVGQRVL